MTWTAAIMPDDALDPDSLVGRMLRPTIKESMTDGPQWGVDTDDVEQE